MNQEKNVTEKIAQKFKKLQKIDPKKINVVIFDVFKKKSKHSLPV